MDFSIILPYLSLLGGLAALVFCGNWLVTGGVEISRYFKISTLVVGLTVVAFGTSAPELFVSIGAAIKGSPEIALGNVIGSNIANIVFIIGLTALICPIPITNKSIGFDLIVMLALTVLLYVLGYNGILGRIEGICLAALLIAYTVWSITKEKKKTINASADAATSDADAKKTEPAKMKPWLSALVVAGSVAGLYFAAEWFVFGARGIAEQWGVSERVIGVSIVALGTSMPELVASLIAAIRKEMDISVGNIVGSNIFNIAMVLGATATIKPLSTGELPVFTNDMLWAFGAAVALSLAMLPLSKGKITRWKGGVLLLAYAAYMYTLFGMS